MRRTNYCVAHNCSFTFSKAHILPTYGGRQIWVGFLRYLQYWQWMSCGYLSFDLWVWVELSAYHIWVGVDTPCTWFEYFWYNWYLCPSQFLVRFLGLVQGCNLLWDNRGIYLIGRVPVYLYHTWWNMLQTKYVLFCRCWVLS